MSFEPLSKEVENRIDEKSRDSSNDSDNDSHTFANSGLSDGDYYNPIDSYEGRHRWDPQFQWEPKEEKRVVRKVCYLDMPYLLLRSLDCPC